MGVIHQTGVVAVTAGEGDGPDVAALAAQLAGTPAITYGTTNSSGTATTLLRTDDQIKFPTALMSSANSATLTFTDDGTNTLLTNSLGVLEINPAANSYVFVSTDALSTAAQMFLLTAAPAAGQDAMKVTFSTPTGPRTSETYRGFNFSAAMAFTATGCTFSSADAQFNLTPGAGSGGSNNLYQMRLTGGLINNANASFSEVVQLDISGARRLVASPTVTTSETVRLECPTIGATDQVGLHVKNRTAQVTATNRYGVQVDSHNSGTNRWSFWGSNKVHCNASDFIANASAFGFCNRDSQSSSAGGGGTARYWRMYTDASATGVSGDVTIAIDSAGNMTATRAGGAAGTVLLKLVDVGTAAVTT